MFCILHHKLTMDIWKKYRTYGKNIWKKVMNDANIKWTRFATYSQIVEALLQNRGPDIVKKSHTSVPTVQFLVQRVSLINLLRLCSSQSIILTLSHWMRWSFAWTWWEMSEAVVLIVLTARLCSETLVARSLPVCPTYDQVQGGSHGM